MEAKQSRRLTMATLKKKGACSGQVALFRKMFGASVDVTEALCVEHAAVFSWQWGAENLLTASAYAEYQRVTDAAYAEYRRVTDAAYAEYQRVSGAAYAEYQRVRDAAYAEYERVRSPAYAEYQRVRAPAGAEYRRVTARAFARAYINDGE